MFVDELWVIYCIFVAESVIDKIYRMKKTHMLLLLVSGFFACGALRLHAQEISKNEARAKALSFFRNSQEAKNRRKTVSVDAADDEVTLAYTSRQGDEVHYYAYNNKKGGFVLIGGDKAAREVLGYCANGSFDYATLPENVRDWLNGYDEQIHYAIEQVKQGNLIVADANEAKSRNAVRKSQVANLLNTKWDQDEPYNSLVPSLGEGYTGNAALATGCVATAMAQVMKYWNYPNQGVGSNSYTKKYTITNASNVKESVTLTFSADFGNTTYQWGNMADTYASEYSGTDSENAVATLMYHCGVALNMNYGQVGGNGSSASTSNIPKVLKQYFKYDDSARYVERSKYSTEEWETLIHDELASGHPMVYRGSSSGGSGHAFVCHGYIADYDYYAFNWGWGGSYDGFYPLTGTGALQPNGTGIGGSSSGSAYAIDQAAVIGIKPNGSTENNAFVLEDDETQTVNYVPVSITTTKLNVGETASVTLPSDYSGNVTYSSSDENVATINNGTVTAISQGTATITIKASSDANYIETVRKIVVNVGSVISIEDNCDTYNFTSVPYFTSDNYVTSSDNVLHFGIANRSSDKLQETLYILINNRISSVKIPMDANESFGVNLTLGSLYNNLTVGQTYTMYFFHTKDETNKTLSDPYNVPSITFTYAEGRRQYDYTIKPVSTDKSDIGYGTLCLPMSCDIPANVMAFECGTYAVDDNGKKVIELSRAVTIERNTPYIIIGTPGTYSLSGVWNEEKAYVQKGFLVGVMSTDYLLDSSKNQYLLQNHNGDVSFYVVGSERNGKTFSRYRSFLQLPSAGESKMSFRLPDDDAVTKVENIVSSDVVPEIVGIYSLDGVRLGQLRNGMNIIKMSDGRMKKVYVK